MSDVLFCSALTRLRRDTDCVQSDVHVIEQGYFLFRAPSYRCRCAFQRIVPEFSAAGSGGYDATFLAEHDVSVRQFLRILAVLAEVFDILYFFHSFSSIQRSSTQLSYYIIIGKNLLKIKSFLKFKSAIRKFLPFSIRREPI